MLCEIILFIFLFSISNQRIPRPLSEAAHARTHTFFSFYSHVTTFTPSNSPWVTNNPGILSISYNHYIVIHFNSTRFAINNSARVELTENIISSNTNYYWLSGYSVQKLVIIVLKNYFGSKNYVYTIITREGSKHF